ncbi:MAG: carbohydrate ABC transporter permease [Firmicutes bacterium]|nr:carbohydrate ABC transporter permease [Bacillota bacterium]
MGSLHYFSTLKSSQKRMETLGKLLTHLILICGAIVVMIPFAWMLSTALKRPSEIFRFPPQWIPSKPQWHNFVIALTAYPFGNFLKNTLIITTLSTVGTVLSCSMAGFAFARLRWPGRDLFFLILLTTMMLPTQVTLVPEFILFRWLGWVNTHCPLFIPAWFARQPFYVFLMRQFFMTIPLELDDAAKIDGASYLTLFTKILLPMAKPAVGIVAILFFQFKWDEFFGPLIYLHDQRLFTLALGLRAFQGGQYGSDWNLMMAASLVFMIPLLGTFYFAQKRFVQGIVVTGIKG